MEGRVGLAQKNLDLSLDAKRQRIEPAQAELSIVRSRRIGMSRWSWHVRAMTTSRFPKVRRIFCGCVRSLSHTRGCHSMAARA